MKILVTGMTAKQVGSTRAFDLSRNCLTVVHHLREGGHEVDWRPVVPGEDLSAYERVVTYLGPPNALSSIHLYGVLWALHSRPDALFALCDWQIRQIVTGTRSVVKSGIETMFKEILQRNHREEARAIQDQLFETLKELTDETGKGKRICLTPLFGKGNPEKLGFVPVKKFVTFDPTVYWIQQYEGVLTEKGVLDVNRPRSIITPKAKQWVHASLLNKDSWVEKQRFNWPVLSYGNKKQNQPRVPEVELLPIIAGSWGLISAPHYQPSSGWWRVRFANAYACRTIVFGDLREMEVVYGGGNFPRYYGEVERMNDGQLQRMVDTQMAALRDRMMPADVLKDTINRGVEAA